ncbi:hypothetical protein ABZ135_35245 [Streptomyces sp. NPDC006339]|uniref:hypothetical protein n=1 Tax=Streptomyces sp. NPDC006339 TaxID=3156755 RepID=UPI0033B764B4
MAQRNLPPSALEATPQAASDDVAADRWLPVSGDPDLGHPPSTGAPGKRRPGEDLDLAIGWDRFEKLMLAVSSRVLAIRGIKFRRYGVQGQVQHGIDLAGRDVGGRFIVVQCKDYQEFTAGDLRKAVETFTGGRRPFGAGHLIIATSAPTERTQLADELAALQEEHDDLELDLWGAEQINDFLRYQADVVARFWTRETAEVFCTGAPLPGVPAPPLDRQQQADRILVGPLKTSDVKPILREAEAERAVAPDRSARKYGELSTRLEKAGFRGHASVLRVRQLEALREAGLFREAAELAGHLAATALHHGDRFEPRRLARLLHDMTRSDALAETEHGEAINQHARLIRAAVDAILHPLGAASDKFADVLDEARGEPATYQPLLVLHFAERLFAVESDPLETKSALIDSAIAQAEQQARDDYGDDIVMRLRLLRAEYDGAERRALLAAARQHAVPGRHAALIKSREARRYCLEGRAEEAADAWREAVHDAIHAGLNEEAAYWLYAIRAVNVQYGPLTTEIDDEHRLAQALRATGASRVLDRVRDPREQAMSSLVRKKPIEAVLSARCWLTDSAVTGSWAHETEAADLLGDLYADNGEVSMATSYYQRAGKSKKLVGLAESAGDRLLPMGSLHKGPWWVLHARAAQVAAQADLIQDHAAARLLDDLTDLATKGLAGELTDSPTQSLTVQAVKSACALASRGTQEQAGHLLGLLAPEVPRERGHHRHIDDEHAVACVDIASTHDALAAPALIRLFDLADQGVQKASNLITEDAVLRRLGARSPLGPSAEQAVASSPLTEEQRGELRDKAVDLVMEKHHLADVILAELDPDHASVRVQAAHARDRILGRPEPDPHRVGFGTRMVSDSFLAGFLDEEDRQKCLAKLLEVAGDPREAAFNRQDALTGARNLVIRLPAEDKAVTFQFSKAFVHGDRDGSHLDAEVTGRPHPLSSFQISSASASLRGHGMYLAAASAAVLAEREWVRDRALDFLHSDDGSLVQAAAVTLSAIGSDVTGDSDLNLLATHQHIGVRQASAVLCMQHVERHQELAMRLANDSDVRVRRTLAEAAADVAPERVASTAAILEILREDVRHSVRAGAFPRHSSASV